MVEVLTFHSNTYCSRGEGEVGGERESSGGGSCPSSANSSAEVKKRLTRSWLDVLKVIKIRPGRGMYTLYIHIELREKKNLEKKLRNFFSLISLVGVPASPPGPDFW